jgi:small conductance mechanosensitive channel
MDSTLSSLAKYFTAANLTTTLVRFGWKVLSAIIVLLIGLILIRIVTSLVRSTLKRTVRDTTVRSYTQSAAQIILWVILVIILLGVFGIETTALAALLGAATLAIGLALQGSLSNFAAGFMLLLFRPFKAGDEVEVSNVTGRVIEIGIFSTIIDTAENVRAFVPNGAIFTGVIKNRSVNAYLRIEVKITVPNSTDITRVQQIIHRLLAANELVLEVPNPEIQIVEDPSLGVTIAVRPFTKLRNVEAVRTTVSKAIREELRNAGIDVVK